MQVDPERHHRVFGGTVSALKLLFPSLPVEYKYLVSVKKLLVGESDWTCVKEVLGWTIDMEAGTVSPPLRNLWELLTLVDLPATQRRIGWK